MQLCRYLCFFIVPALLCDTWTLHQQGAAQGPANDLISQNWDSQTRDKLFPSRIDPERKEAATTFAHGYKYNCRSQSFLGGRYDLGTAAAALPRALGPAAATTIDIDYYRYRLFVRDLGSTFVGFDTLAYREADLRNAKYPANTQPLFFARGLGVVYLLISASPEDLDSGYTTLAREVEKARDDIIAGIRREGPAIPPQKNSNASLICKTHQAIGGLLLQRVLSALGYDVFYHVTWGIKVPAGDLSALDEAAKRANDEKPPSDDPEMSNASDVANTRRTSSIPVMRSYPIGRSNFGDRILPTTATSMRTYGQAPGIFDRPHGSTQTRSGTPWPGIDNITFYNIIDHDLRTGGPVTWFQPETVGRAKRNLTHLRGLLDSFPPQMAWHS